MASILKFFRIIFFFALYFLLCMVVVTVALQGWPVGGQMLFAFGLPILLVWWQEKRRSRKVEAKALVAESTKTRVTQSEPVARVSAYEKRIERERERTREANAIQSSSIAPPKPPKQDYAEVVRAGQSCGSSTFRHCTAI